LVILTSYLTKSSKKVRTPLRMVKAGWYMSKEETGY
jgi:hypothetical protein